MAKTKWEGYKHKGTKKPSSIKVTKFQISLACIAILALILVAMYIYYPSILPQLSSFIAEQGNSSTQLSNSTILKINYVKG